MEFSFDLNFFRYIWSLAPDLGTVSGRLAIEHLLAAIFSFSLFFSFNLHTIPPIERALQRVFADITRCQQRDSGPLDGKCRNNKGQVRTIPRYCTTLGSYRYSVRWTWRVAT